MAQKPARRDLVIQQGSDQFIPLAIKAGGALKSLTGHTARLQVRRSPDDPVLLDLTIANGGITLGTMGTAPHQYNLLISVLGSLTASLADWGTGEYDLFLYDSFSKPQKIMEGVATLNRRITR